MSTLCKDCKHRFRMVSVPHKIEEGEDSVIITIYCTQIVVDLTDGDVVECSHYDSKNPPKGDPHILIDM